MTYAEYCAEKCEWCAKGKKRIVEGDKATHQWVDNIGHYGDLLFAPCTAPTRDQFEQELQAELKRCQYAYYKTAYEVEQALGKALHYPKYADDPKTFPEAAGTDAVCVGEHVPASLADEAAQRISELEREKARMLEAITAALEHCEGWRKFQDDETAVPYFPKSLERTLIAAMQSAGEQK